MGPLILKLILSSDHWAMAAGFTDHIFLPLGWVLLSDLLTSYSEQTFSVGYGDGESLSTNGINCFPSFTGR